MDVAGGLESKLATFGAPRALNFLAWHKSKQAVVMMNGGSTICWPVKAPRPKIHSPALLF